ncbi:hypothetical protein KSC_033690 [Ktedonobacter sp. SOSP1-52]|uniref:hypothetical protein n=1 Tax=Ktedonobacter sp. SOSP1-52 TaxID=2778366 RepID=UPI001915A59D|nr:hypothetical protein [Ktedonobacter sp. SOSP1-52]GHO64477.1 hypothetical protein KSC_033690 [Ktedonobacter sp. SOSP1-52]
MSTSQRRQELQQRWRVLLIGGSSGTGKSSIARQLAAQLAISWLQVDDLRLALQNSRISFPKQAHTDALYFFTRPGIWRGSPEALSQALIAVGATLRPALEIVIANHIDIDAPLILEGDSILPSLLENPLMHQYKNRGRLQVVFLQEPDEKQLSINITQRGRGTVGMSEEELRTEARAKWLYGQWLAHEAMRWGLPVLEPQPWETLGTRILGTCYEREEG